MPLKTYIVLCLLLGLTMPALAQIDDKPQEGFRIMVADTNYLEDVSVIFKLSPITGLTNKNVKMRINYDQISDPFKKKSGVNITQKSNLKQKQWDIKQRFNEDYKDVSKFSKDYYLGDIKTTSKTVVIKCRDHEYVDGDRIKLMVNNAVIHPNLTLTGDYYTIDIDLVEGFNTINFIALNEGLSRPNTAEVRVFDEDGNQLAANRWLITTGYKASLVVLRE